MPGPSGEDRSLRIVAQHVVREGHTPPCNGFQSGIGLSRGNRQRALTNFQRADKLAGSQDAHAQMGEDSRQTGPVIQRRSQRLGRAQMLETLLEVSKREKHLPKLAPEIDVLFDGFPAFRETTERDQCLLEARHRLAVRGTRDCLGTGLPAIGDSFLPDLAANSVMCQPFEVLDQSIRIEPLDRSDDAPVKATPPLGEEARIRNLMRERVPERVLDVRKEPRLVEELCTR